MRRSDFSSVIELEREIFPDAWPQEAFEEHLETTEADILIAEIEGQLVGYACYHTIDTGLHMTNLAVAPSHRRKSVANGLLDYILGLAREWACELIFLEVRPSNEIARRFYEAAGFQTVERKPGYYDNPTEDALVMTKRVTEVSCD